MILTKVPAEALLEVSPGIPRDVIIGIILKVLPGINPKFSGSCFLQLVPNFYRNSFGNYSLGNFSTSFFIQLYQGFFTGLLIVTVPRSLSRVFPQQS